jgi:hypothetical protein
MYSQSKHRINNILRRTEAYWGHILLFLICIFIACNVNNIIGNCIRQGRKRFIVKYFPLRDEKQQ